MDADMPVPSGEAELVSLQVEDNDVKVESNQASSNGSNGSSDSAESQGGKYAPKETFEDGSVMYAAADLEATDYEAVLTS